MIDDFHVRTTVHVNIENPNALSKFADKGPLMIQLLSHSMRIAMITIVRNLTLDYV